MNSPTLLFFSGFLLGAYAATLVRYLLDALPLGPHTVRCDGGEITPPPDLEQWINKVETEFIKGK
jgi:hypothetical protein